MSKKFFITTFIAITLAAQAQADDYGFFFKPYVGADYDYYHVNYQGISGTPYSYEGLFADSFNGGDVHVGARVHKYLGFEASYFDTASESKSGILGTTASSSARLDGGTFDVMGYLPIDQAQKFELIATAGLALTYASGSVTVGGTSYSANGSETRGRVGAGAEYWITDNLNVRGIVRYQDADFSGIANNVVITSLGLNWQF